MLTIVNPATESVIRTIDEDSGASIRDKAARARSAQPAWADTPLDARRAVLGRFVDLLERDRERLARTLTSEMGKPITQSLNELRAMPERLRFFSDNVERATADETVLDQPASSGPALEERIRYEPLGVIANISAWNYPYFVGSNVFVPALLTGNAVLYKPSEHATLTGLAIAELLHAAGVPEDVFVPVVGGGPAGAALLDAPIDGVFFTGSFGTGQRIATQVAGRMIPVQLELGGKDPVYICDDVDVEAAAGAMAEGAFYNAGQSCCAVERIYVHRSIASDFTAALCRATERLRVGDPLDPETDVGPLARREQFAVLEKQVADARARGGRVLCGGARRSGVGWFFAPTVVADATAEMSLMRDESFGPVIGVQVVNDDEEALALMNDTDYGLTAAVYTRDGERAQRILARVDAGTAYWNCCDRVSPRLPWSGRKHSGIGSTLSLAGIRAFVRPKAYHLRQPAVETR